MEPIRIPFRIEIFGNCNRDRLVLITPCRRGEGAEGGGGGKRRGVLGIVDGRKGNDMQVRTHSPSQEPRTVAAG